MPFQNVSTYLISFCFSEIKKVLKTHFFAINKMKVGVAATVAGSRLPLVKLFSSSNKGKKQFNRIINPAIV